MKTFLLALLLGFCTTALTSAAEGDFKIGNHQGYWGGFRCTYEIKSKARGQAIFYGKIHLHQTQEYDDLVVVQKSDQSVEITRKLRGQAAGKTQYVHTYPPRVFVNSIEYSTKGKGGVGMQATRNLASSLWMTR